MHDYITIALLSDVFLLQVLLKIYFAFRFATMMTASKLRPAYSPALRQMKFVYIIAKRLVSFRYCRLKSTKVKPRRQRAPTVVIDDDGGHEVEQE